MTIEKKFISEFKVYAPRDLSKKWFVYFYKNGKRIRKYGNINRYDTFEQRMDEMDILIEQLKTVNSIKDATSQKMVNYLTSNKNIWRKKTYQGYLCKVRMLTEFTDGKINKVSVASFFNMLKNDKANTTYNTYRQHLGTILKGIGSYALIEDIQTVKQNPTPARYFQPHQVQELKQYISSNNSELWLFCQFMFYCFIRPKEIRLLRYEDILFDEHKIIIKGENSKNGKSEYVAIPKSFQSEIDKLKGAKGLIFNVGMNTMSSRHRRILKILNYNTKEYKLYSWKHTGAVMATKAGVTMKQLQIQLRHHSLDQVNEYLRQMGVSDLDDLSNKFPSI